MFSCCFLWILFKVFEMNFLNIYFREIRLNPGTVKNDIELLKQFSGKENRQSWNLYQSTPQVHVISVYS